MSFEINLESCVDFLTCHLDIEMTPCVQRKSVCLFVKPRLVRMSSDHLRSSEGHVGKMKKKTRFG